MKVAAISLNIAWQDIDKNLERAEEFILQAKTDGCDVVVFPEVFNTGFIAEVGKYAESPHSKTYQTLQQLALTHSINIVAGASEKEANEKAHNIALVFDDHGNEEAKYSKLQPFNYANEGKYFAPGDKSVIFGLAGVPCSVFICYDLRFPEIFRQVAREVEVIFVIANWPYTRELHWQNLLIARAIENQCFIVGVNRIGDDGVGLKFHGASMVIDPLGKILMQTDEKTEYEVCEFDTSEVVKVRKKFPFLDDIRFV